MSDETIVLDASTLFVHLDGVPIDGFPDAGTIATDNKVAPEADFVGTIGGGGVAVLNRSVVREVVVNVLPFGTAHAKFTGAVALQGLGLIHSFSMAYGGAQWLSPALVVTSLGTNTLNADGVEFVPVTLKGAFTKFDVSGFKAPTVATAEQLNAASGL